MRGLRASATIAFLAISSASLLLPDTLVAEVDTVQLPSHVVFTTDGNDTLWSDELWPAYLFTIVNDSMVVTCDYGRIARNDSRFWLRKWFNDSLWDEEDSALSHDSRTRPCTLAQGDTLSFVRRLSWYPRLEGFQDSANFYYSKDTLTYVVKLHRASDDLVLAILDSIGLLPRDPPGFPSIIGTCDLSSWVKYQVPEALDGVDAYLKIWVSARGAGSFTFMRYDNRKAHIEAFASDPGEIATTEYYCGMGKRVADAARIPAAFEARATGRSISIMAEYVAGDHIVLTDGSGVAVQLLSPVMNTREFTATVESAGKYFVVLIRNGVRVATSSVVVF